MQIPNWLTRYARRFREFSRKNECRKNISNTNRRRSSLTVKILDACNSGYDGRQSVEENREIFLEEDLSTMDDISSPSSVIKSSKMRELQNDIIKLKRLGSGSSSSVFMAVHPQSLKLFSVKEVPLWRQAKHMIRAEILALKHQQKSLFNGKLADEKRACPHIVEYYGYHEVAKHNLVRIAVEFVGGGNMQDWITHKTPAPEPWLKSVIFQTLKALSALHATGHIHLDVKPANILITLGGDVKLADFGLSASLSEGGMLGTRRFMSPERLSGHVSGPEADVWSLGVVVISAALCQDFFSGSVEAFGQLMETDKVPEKLAKIGKEKLVSPDLLGFVSKCLALCPNDRPTISKLLSHTWLKGHDQWQTKCKHDVLTRIETHHQNLCVDPKTVIEDIVSARNVILKQSSELETIIPIAPYMVEPLSNELHVPASQFFNAIVASEMDLHSEREVLPFKTPPSCGESPLTRQHSTLSDTYPSFQRSDMKDSDSHKNMDNCDLLSVSSTITMLSHSTSSTNLNQNERALDPIIVARLMEMDRKLTRSCKFRFCVWQHHSSHGRCFTGKDAVKWLIKMDYAKTEAVALDIGNAMIETGAVYHIRSEHGFENRKLLYMFKKHNRD